MVKKIFFVFAAAVLQAAFAFAQTKDASQLFNDLRAPPESVQANITKGTLTTAIDHFIDVNSWDDAASEGLFIYSGADSGEPNTSANYLNLGFAYGFSSLYLAFSVTKQDNMTLMLAHKVPGAFRLNVAVSENPAFGLEWGKGLDFSKGGLLDLDLGFAGRFSGFETGVGIKIGANYHTKNKWELGGYIIPYIGFQGINQTGINFLFKLGKTIEVKNFSLGIAPKANICSGFGTPLEIAVDLGFKYKIKKTFGIYSGFTISLFKIDGAWYSFGAKWMSVDNNPLALGVSIEPSNNFSLQVFVKNHFLDIHANGTGAIDLNDSLTFLGNITRWQFGLVLSYKLAKFSDLTKAIK